MPSPDPLTWDKSAGPVGWADAPGAVAGGWCAGSSPQIPGLPFPLLGLASVEAA